jgi:hypothetical protein
VGIVASIVEVQELGCRVVKGNGVVGSPGEHHSHSCFEGASVFLPRSSVGDKGDVVDIAQCPECRVSLLEGVE